VTESPWGAFDQSDFRLFERVSKALRKRAKGLLEEEDLYQSCALWALENPHKYRDALKRSESHAYQLLWSRMADHIRAERARVEGYDPSDQFMYSPKVLKKVIPLAFDPTWMEESQDYDKEPGTPGKGGDPPDPANAWVLVADVKTAFPKLGEQDRLLLHKTLVGPGEYGQVCRQIAGESGVETKAVQVAVHKALTRLGKLLRSE
jgi:DNA-directed RNA polymerase specialized sigma24 family protein